MPPTPKTLAGKRPVAPSHQVLGPRELGEASPAKGTVIKPGGPSGTEQRIR